MKYDYAASIKEKFQAEADPVKADPMKKYMKNRFDFLGLSRPHRTLVQKEFLKKDRLPGLDQVEGIIKQLWNLPEREYHYFAMDMAEHFIKKFSEKDIELFEYMITHKSWWDTVDLIATHMVGAHFKRFPRLVGPYTGKWIESGDMWLQRTAILFQLKYKIGTDVELLFRMITPMLNSTEFFTRKAIGWALREYSKTAPEVVLNFVESHALSPLSRKEALKIIDRK